MPVQPDVEKGAEPQSRGKRLDRGKKLLDISIGT